MCWWELLGTWPMSKVHPALPTEKLYLEVPDWIWGKHRVMEEGKGKCLWSHDGRRERGHRVWQCGRWDVCACVSVFRLNVSTMKCSILGTWALEPSDETTFLPFEWQESLRWNRHHPGKEESIGLSYGQCSEQEESVGLSFFSRCFYFSL